MPETRVFRWANMVTSTLNGAINNTTTSVVIADASALPPPGFGEIITMVLRDDAIGTYEILNVTGISTNTLTVERGAEGTTAVAWPSGTTIKHSLTAAWFQARGFTTPIPVIEYVGSLCDYAGTDTTPVTMNLPAGVVEGDLLIFMGTITGTTVTSQPTGWKQLSVMKTYSLNDAFVQVIGQDILLYRFMVAGDTNISFPYTGTLGARGGCIHAFRNVNPDRPFPQMMANQNSWANLSGNDNPNDMYISTPDMNNVSVGSKVVSYWRHPPSATTPLLAGGVNSGNTIEYIDFYEGVDLFDSPNTLGFASLIYGPVPNEYENLLPWTTKTFNTNWTKTNIAVNDFDASAPVRTDLDPVVGGPARHAISTTATLVAGTIYTWTVFVCPDNANVDYTVLSVVPPSQPEFGNTFDDNTSKRNGTIGSGFSRVHNHNAGQAGYSSQPTSITNCVFTASVSGVHTFYIGFTMTAGVTDSTYANTADGGNLFHTILHQHEYPTPAWESLRTSGSPVTAVAGTVPRLLRGMFSNGGSPWHNYTFEVAPLGGQPDLIRLTAGARLGLKLSADRLSVIGSGGGSPTITVYAFATGCVDPWQNGGSGKFYFEVTCSTSVWDVEASPRSSVAMTLPWVSGVPCNNGVSIGSSSQGVYSYQDQGKVYENGTLVTTAATYNNPKSLGSIVGVAVDFTNNTIAFYKGGVLQWTATIAVGHRNVPLRAAFISTTASSQERAATANFKGPFANLPVGFLAYDWENA